jgi:hypothetical protein
MTTPIASIATPIFLPRAKPHSVILRVPRGESRLAEDREPGILRANTRVDVSIRSRLRLDLELGAIGV